MPSSRFARSRPAPSSSAASSPWPALPKGEGLDRGGRAATGEERAGEADAAE